MSAPRLTQLMMMGRFAYTGVRGGLKGTTIKGSRGAVNPAATGVFWTTEKTVAEEYAQEGGEIIGIKLTELNKYGISELPGNIFKTEDDVDISSCPSKTREKT